MKIERIAGLVALSALPLLASCAGPILVGPPGRIAEVQPIRSGQPSPSEPTFCVASYEGSTYGWDIFDLAQTRHDADVRYRRFRDLRLLTREHPEADACDVLLKIRAHGTVATSPMDLEAYSAFTQELVWQGSAKSGFFSDGGGVALLAPHLQREFQPSGNGFAQLKASQARGHRPSAQDIVRFAGSGLVPEAVSKSAKFLSLKGGGAREGGEALPAAAGASEVSSATAPERSKAQQSPPAASDLDDLPAAGAAQPHRYAVVVGIEKYREKLPNADFAESDAKLTAEYFKRVLGIPDENLALLVGDRATRTDLEKYFDRWLPNRVEAGDEVFVYFSGHGAPDPAKGDAYLLPYDGDPTYIEETGYSLKNLYARLAKLPAKRIVVAMDSCFSGAGGRSVLARGARPLVTVSAASDVPGKLTVIAASAGNEISNSYEEKGHGLFTYFFLKGLKEKGADFRAVYDYLKPQVAREARRGYNADQTPQWAGGQ